MTAPKGETADMKLNPRQRRFCELYARSPECFGNGVQAYREAFTLKGMPVSYDAAKVNASKLLAKVSVTKYINDLLDADGLNNQFVDKQLVLLISQNVDLQLKLSAIREYNRMKGRFVRQPDRLHIEPMPIQLFPRHKHPFRKGPDPEQ